MHMKYFLKDLKEIYQLKDLDIEGWSVLKWILNKRIG